MTCTTILPADRSYWLRMSRSNWKHRRRETRTAEMDMPELSDAFNGNITGEGVVLRRSGTAR